MTVRLGFAGVPDFAGEIRALAACLQVEPVFLLPPDAAVAGRLDGWAQVTVANSDGEGWLAAARDAGLSGLFPGSCDFVPVVAEATAHLHLATLPCMSAAEQAALPIEDAQLFESDALDHLTPDQRRALPIPAWVRAACTRGDGSCMRLEHHHDLSLATAKLHKRNTGGPVRIQPVVEGPVYRALAFRTGTDLQLAALIAEEVTSSVYRVPLSMVLPLDREVELRGGVEDLLAQVAPVLPEGWGYVEVEMAETPQGLRLLDVQCPARLDPKLRELVRHALGVDLLLATLSCALGRHPDLAPTRHRAVALTWLLTRSGVVTGFQGVEEARALPGVLEVHINAVEGDILTHVVDLPTRDRGGYIVAEGENETIARARLEAAREMVWINTSPALA